MTAEESHCLDVAFSKAELMWEIGKLKIGKSPGPEGFTPRFYKYYKDDLAHFFLKVCNSTGKENAFPSLALEELILVLPKTGKDLTECSNFRPISLINVDKNCSIIWGKIFLSLAANIPAKRTKQALSEVEKRGIVQEP